MPNVSNPLSGRCRPAGTDRPSRVADSSLPPCWSCPCTTRASQNGRGTWGDFAKRRECDRKHRAITTRKHDRATGKSRHPGRGGGWKRGPPPASSGGPALLVRWPGASRRFWRVRECAGQAGMKEPSRVAAAGPRGVCGLKSVPVDGHGDDAVGPADSTATPGHGAGLAFVSREHEDVVKHVTDADVRIGRREDNTFAADDLGHALPRGAGGRRQEPDRQADVVMSGRRFAHPSCATIRSPLGCVSSEHEPSVGDPGVGGPAASCRTVRRRSRYPSQRSARIGSSIVARRAGR